MAESLESLKSYIGKADGRLAMAATAKFAA